jgi:hypothetical protein
MLLTTISLLPDVATELREGHARDPRHETCTTPRLAMLGATTLNASTNCSSSEAGALRRPRR